jgi:glycosyltransferase involved in cell wall biosynthesis
MKICTITWARPDVYPAGVERTAWCFCRELSKAGSRVHVVYNYDNYPAGADEDVVEGVYLHGIKAGYSPLARLNFYLKALGTIRILNRSLNFDIISINGFFALPLTLFLRKFNASVVLHTYTTSLGEMRTYLAEILKTLPYSLNKLANYALETFFEVLFLRFLDGIIVPTNCTISEIKRYIKSSKGVYVVPLGHDVYERFYDDVKNEVNSFKRKFDNKRIILFIGADWKRKGVRYLLQAFTRVREFMPSILFMVGPFNREYLPLIEKLNLRLGEDIIVTGYVVDRELAMLYAACDVFVLPSFHEGFSQTVLEAMSFGKPVVVSPMAAYPIVENNIDGYIVPPSNVSSMADTIIRLLMDESLREKIGNNARKKAELYSWRFCAQKLYKVYEEIAGKKERIFDRRKIAKRDSA